MSKEPESKFKSFLAAKKGEAEQDAAASESPDDTIATKRGRPAGKRSDSEFEQVTAYIRKSTHIAVKIALLQEGQKRQFSELVEHLLSEWVRAIG